MPPSPPNLRSKSKTQNTVSQNPPDPSKPSKTVRTPLSSRGRGRGAGVATPASRNLPSLSGLPSASMSNNNGTLPKTTIPRTSAVPLEVEAQRVNQMIDGHRAAAIASNSIEDLLGNLQAPQTHHELSEELRQCKRKIQEMTLQMQAKNEQPQDLLSIPVPSQQRQTIPNSNSLRFANVAQNPGTASNNRNPPVLRSLASSAHSEENSEESDQYDPPPRRVRQPLPRCDMEKWKLRFSSGNGTKFWKRMERLQACYGYDNDTVLRHFHELLDGHALDWYHQVFDQYDITTLLQLKQEFLRTFKPRESDLMIISAMYNRKQNNDSFENFYNAIVDMNFTLQKPLPDEQLIEILRTNVTDEIRQRIFTFETKDRIRFFHKANQAYQDACQSSLREKKRPIQDYRFAKKINEIDLEELTLGEIEELTSNLAKWQSKRTSRSCFNCKSLDHLLRDCPNEITRVFCFKCGKEGVYSFKCECSLNHPRGVETVRSSRPQ